VLFALQTARRGIPAMAHAATLGYLDYISEQHPPLNLVQAQRDCFGAHTYARIDRPPEQAFHSVWAPTKDPAAAARAKPH